MPEPPEAELLLDRLPCTSCKDFRAEIEDETGIKFTFHYVPKVGNVYLEKDAYNNQIFPLCVDEKDIVSSSDEADEEEEMELARRLQTQAVLRPSKSVPRALPGSQEIRKSTSITKVQKYTYNAAARSPKGGAWRPDRQPYIEEVEEIEESEEDEYTPTPVRKKKPTRQAPSPISTPSGSRSSPSK